MSWTGCIGRPSASDAGVVGGMCDCGDGSLVRFSGASLSAASAHGPRQPFLVVVVAVAGDIQLRHLLLTSVTAVTAVTGGGCPMRMFHVKQESRTVLSAGDAGVSRRLGGAARRTIVRSRQVVGGKFFP